VRQQSRFQTSLVGRDTPLRAAFQRLKSCRKSPMAQTIAAPTNKTALAKKQINAAIS
jgi:hypothetical protein